MVTVDFYCHVASLVIEVDGDIHVEQGEYDAGRDNVLEEMGLKVIHFRNDEVLQNTPRVLGQMSDALHNSNGVL